MPANHSITNVLSPQFNSTQLKLTFPDSSLWNPRLAHRSIVMKEQDTLAQLSPPLFFNGGSQLLH